MNSYNSLVTKLIDGSKVSQHLNNDQRMFYIEQFLNNFYNSRIEIPTVVVAGTKGKGSTCAVIDSALRQCGFKTGLFTSPHLETARERIKIDGVSISEEEYVQAYESLISKLNEKGMKHPPFFGLHTLMSADIFTKHNIDVAVVEVGIGGRFDWTKIYTPSTSVITHLEYDHTEVLGKTAKSIAWNKAGIFAKNVPSFSAPQAGPFMNELVRCALEVDTPLQIVMPYWEGKTGLAGPTARENSSLGADAALSMGRVLGKPLNLTKLTEGVAKATIYGRYQKYMKDGIRYLLDGAHTKESILSCRQWYDSLKRKTDKDVLIVSTTKDRDPNKILESLVKKQFKDIIFIKKGNKDLTSVNHKSANSIKEAIDMALASTPRGILVTGSLHLVGHALKSLGFPVP